MKFAADDGADVPEGGAANRIADSSMHAAAVSGRVRLPSMPGIGWLPGFEMVLDFTGVRPYDGLHPDHL